MHPEFWLERWQQNRIGFHQLEVGAALVRHWSRLELPPGARVFVPLSGKSLDMQWLLQNGFEVVGVELSEIAVRDFFTEHGLKPTVEQRDKFSRYKAEGIELLCGDYFALEPNDLDTFSAVFDRASLVALPPQMRRQYVEKMIELCAPGTRTLLITLEYEQSQMSGPPFSVMEDEVRQLYGATHRIEVLERAAPSDFEKFAQRGVSKIAEVVYRLERQ